MHFINERLFKPSWFSWTRFIISAFRYFKDILNAIWACLRQSYGTFFAGANISLILCCRNVSFFSSSFLFNQSGWWQRGTGFVTYEILELRLAETIWRKIEKMLKKVQEKLLTKTWRKVGLNLKKSLTKVEEKVEEKFKSWTTVVEENLKKVEENMKKG